MALALRINFDLDTRVATFPDGDGFLTNQEYFATLEVRFFSGGVQVEVPSSWTLNVHITESADFTNLLTSGTLSTRNGSGNDFYLSGAIDSGTVAIQALFPDGTVESVDAHLELEADDGVARLSSRPTEMTIYNSNQ